MKFKNIIITMVLILSIATASISTINVAASSLEQQQQQTIEKIEELKKAKNNTDLKTKELKKESNEIQSKISALDKEADSISDEITYIENKINKTLKDIEFKEQEIKDMEIKLESQYADMKKRIQYMYENGVSMSYIMALLSGEDVSNMLTKIDYISIIADYDRQMFEDFKMTKKTMEDEKSKLEKSKEDLDKLKKENENKKRSLESLINQKSDELSGYKAKINSNTAESKEYAAEILKQEKALEAIENQIAAEASKNSQNTNDNTNTNVSTGFIWPCPSSKRITSYFGPRTAPVAGASTYHKGIDIGATSGSAIVASASGTVTTSKYSSSAGNYVVVDHGNGMSTVYMHCSALYVSVGQKVTQGQTIAAVGSTGYSTGPHLHFGIIKNGTYVNPLNYI